MENTAIVAMSSKDMTKAIIINDRVEDSFLTGYLLAQGNELRKRMQTSVVEFYFTKKMAASGEPSELPCLLWQKPIR